MSAELSRLSLNTMTVRGWSLPEAVKGCSRAGIPWIGPWRGQVQKSGLEESVRLLRGSDLKVSSLCRGGMFPALSKQERSARLDDNRRAVEEAWTLGTDVLVLVCGAAQDRDIDAARAAIEEGVEALVPHAEEAGVRLGIEPLHPAFAADRSAITTLGEANRLAERIGSPNVGVVVDVYHVWWDPELYGEIERAQGRILGFHVNDWLRGGGDPLTSRGMMGDGAIQLRRIREAVEKAGYDGPIEVEIFNSELWERPGEEVLDLIKARYLEHLWSTSEARAGGHRGTEEYDSA